MENLRLFINLEELLENSNFQKPERINDELAKIITFTRMPRYVKKVSNRAPLVSLLTKVKTKKNHYIFNYRNKKYPFKILSEENIQEFDKKNLLDIETNYKNDAIRVLKLACSMDLINPKVIVCNQKNKPINYLISFEEAKKVKIIDYSKNIIMNKDDYLELFPSIKINTLSTNDLYRIYLFIKESGNYELLSYLLIFSKEMLNDLSKQKMLEEINTNSKFDCFGINKQNFPVLGRYCDYLYFEDSDNNSKYTTERKELDQFTLNKNNSSANITYNSEKQKYTFKNKNITFDFSLLSDSVDSEQIKRDLLSSNRYHKCHINSHNVIAALDVEDKKNAAIVSGKIAVNDIDYVYHSWVEIEGKNVVIDYNHNLIMSKDKYYELYEAIPIQRTSKEEMDKQLEFIINEAEFPINYNLVNYFGPEISKNLEKNKKIFTKKGY